MINNSFCADRRDQSGVALVLVLSILVLLTAVVIAFFMNATTDLTSSKSYSDEMRVRLLADSAVNVVEGQIRAATQGGTGGNILAWASQPGMIRTYNKQGRLGTAYKLYSTDASQITTEPVDLSKEIPENWNKTPGDFVDLNSPSIVIDPDGTITDPNGTSPTKYSARFPIVDGNNLVAPANNAGQLVYDADGDGVPDVEGFSVAKPATYNSNLRIGSNNNPVPMPVRWLYALQNGQLQPRDSQTGKITGASKANPVIGRVAYWTDDDTCKLNINTASEGSLWSRPRAKNDTEVAYSLNIPAQNEFQMFSGHPAKTCLSPVFNSIWPVPDWLTRSNYGQLLPYFDLAPRLSEAQTNGSAGGTQPSDKNSGNGYGVVYDADRLYTSVDELMFNTRITNTSSGLTRVARNTAGDKLTPKLLEATRFFLTASNRAPEVTLFNTPRISLWPLQAKPTARTSKENLLAFCATIPSGSGNLYSFQRLSTVQDQVASAYSPTLDFDLSNPSGARNDQLYQYLQTMTSTAVPGLGGSFAAKYGAATNQILTEMVDLSRSGVNIGEIPAGSYKYTPEGQVMPLMPASGAAAGTKGFGRSCTITEAALDIFRVSNLTGTETTTKFGAMLLLQMFCPSPGFTSLAPHVRVEVLGLDKFTISPTYANGETGPTDTIPLGMPASASNYVEVSVGFSALGNNTEYVGMDTSCLFRGPLGNTLKTFYPPPPGLPNIVAKGYYPLVNQPGNSPGNPGNLPLNAGGFNLNPDGTKTITIKIYTWPEPETGTSGELIQTLQMEFPGSPELPLPKPEAFVTPTDLNPVGTILKNRLGTNDGQADEPDTIFGTRTLIAKNDVVRSVVVDALTASKGDLRVIAGLRNVPSKYFRPHPFYNYPNRMTSKVSPVDPSDRSVVDSNWRFAHSLRAGSNSGWGGYGWYNYSGVTFPNNFLVPGAPALAARKPVYMGSLVAGLPTFFADKTPPYGAEAFPAVPVGLDGAKLTGRDGSLYDGDWDTGQGSLEDGPYINKPDETVAGLVAPNPGGYTISGRATSIYYTRSFANGDNGKTYSPNRQISSAVMFGSLPTGIDPGASSQTAPVVKPWQTLLFCPFPSAGGNFQHPGFGVSSGSSSLPFAPPAPPYNTVPDHFLLDLFTMPIVEPYALSEPLSTQGKVNMNYQIAPFTYIKRSTALRGALKSTTMMAIPNSLDALTNYKSHTGTSHQYRYSINADDRTGTLKGFEDRFDSGDIFRSASEICSVPLVPKRFPTNGQSQQYDDSVAGDILDYTRMQSFWNKSRLTGDNVREEPYGDLYPRLTTKSNTFTVHVRVQTLKKSASTAVDTFVDPTETGSGFKDTVTAEYRGSYQIERYVDPNVKTTGSSDPTQDFPDYAKAGLNATPISNFYKFHTIGVKQF